MHRKRLLFCCLSAFVYTIFLTKGSHGEFVNLYNGVYFDGSLFQYLLVVFDFSILSMFVFGDFTDYVNGHVAYEIIRYGKRGFLYKKLRNTLVVKVLFYEAIKIIFFSVSLLLWYGHIHIIDITKMLYLFISVIMVKTVFMYLQSLIELFYDARIGVLLVSCLYVILLALGSVMYAYHIPSWIYIILFPNISMGYRINSVSIYPVGNLIVLSILLIAVAYFMKRKIKQKDVI